MACVHPEAVIQFPPTLPIPAEVVDIARRLEQAGFETWCVGGAVRDNLLGHENHDFDLATSAPPDQVQRLFRHTIPRGVEHGTVAVLDRQRHQHEVTTFRRDERTDGRHAIVEFGVRLEDDLARRDFTINAIAHHPLTHAWRDLFEGRGDLDRGLIRAVGDPALRFREDYLRIPRALRFAARFGFQIDAPTWAAALDSVAGMEILSAERVRGEWFRGLATAQSPSRLLRLWQDVGARHRWLPELVTSEGTLSRLDHFSPRDPVLMTAYLSTDPRATLGRLRCSAAEIERAARIGRFRARLPDPLDPVAVRRWMAEADAAVDDVLIITGVEDPGLGTRLREAVAQVRDSGAPLRVAHLAITGDDLLAEGFPAGPGMGDLLRSLLSSALEDPRRNNRETLLRLARTLGKQ